MRTPEGHGLHETSEIVVATATVRSTCSLTLFSDDVTSSPRHFVTWLRS